MNEYSRTGAILVAACAFVAACAASDEQEPAAMQGEPLLWSPERLRTTRDLRVCWASAANAAQRDWVRDTLLGQRSWLAWGNLNLVGWNVCQAGEQPDIRLVAGTKMETSADGKRVELDVSLRNFEKWPACVQNGLDREACVRSEALHEIGHALGFASDAHCPEDPVGAGGAPSFDDPQSVMSHCRGPAWLSGADRTGMSSAYGQRTGDDTRLADYDGDGRVDLLCHDVTRGYKWIDYADTSGRYAGSDWSRTNGSWCGWEGARVFKGDFNRDGRTDLLCHDVATGKKWIDYADASGRFGGTDWSTSLVWCASESARLLLGDVNDDGGTDLICHDTVTGHQSWDYVSTSGVFGGTNWAGDVDYCTAPTARLYVGDFNGDGADDLLCHDAFSGMRSIDYSGDGTHAVDWVSSNGWCNTGTTQLLVGDFNADGRDDLLCHDTVSGSMWIDYASVLFGRLEGTNFQKTGAWCSNDRGRLRVGDVNLDGRADLLCHDIIDGGVWVDYADTNGRFDLTEWTRQIGFCADASNELH